METEYVFKKEGKENVFTWKAHIENKIKCVYIMQRLIIKIFSLCLSSLNGNDFGFNQF